MRKRMHNLYICIACVFFFPALFMLLLLRMPLTERRVYVIAFYRSFLKKKQIVHSVGKWRKKVEEKDDGDDDDEEIKNRLQQHSTSLYMKRNRRVVRLLVCVCFVLLFLIVFVVNSRLNLRI